MKLIGTSLSSLRIYYWKTVRFFLHTTVTCSYLGLHSYFIYTMLVTDILAFPNKIVMKAIGNIPYFFSVWVMAAETVYFCSYSVMDVIRMYCLLNKKSELYSSLRPRMKNFVRKTLFSIVFPLSMVAAEVFWIFYYVNKELMYPEIVVNYFTPFMNHIVHTYPVPVSILYMFFDIKEEPPMWESLKLLTISLFAYSSVFTFANHNTDEWTYPVLDTLTPSQAHWVLALSVMSAYVYLFLGYYIFSKIKDVRSYFENKLKSH